MMSLSSQAVEYLALIGIIALWVLLPLIPAVLIYWLFPDTQVAATGLLAGLTVKSSGAFAGYLIVLLVIKPWESRATEIVGGWLHPAWTISGTLKVVDKDGKPSHPGDKFFQKIHVRTQPEMESFTDPTFTITVPEGPRGIPNIYFVTDFGNVQARVVKKNEDDKTAELDGPVEIREQSINSSDDRRPLTVPSQ